MIRKFTTEYFIKHSLFYCNFTKKWNYWHCFLLVEKTLHILLMTYEVVKYTNGWRVQELNQFTIFGHAFNELLGLSKGKKCKSVGTCFDNMKPWRNYYHRCETLLLLVNHRSRTSINICMIFHCHVLKFSS